MCSVITGTVAFSGLKSVLSEKIKLGVDSSIMVSVSKECHLQKPQWVWLTLLHERKSVELQDPLRRIKYLSSEDFKQSEVVTTALYILYHLAQCRHLEGIGKQIETDFWY